MNPQDQPNSMNLDSLIASPSKKTGGKPSKEKETPKGYKSLMEKKHPNAMVFDNDGRLFVGDSYGQINVWRIAVHFQQVTVVDHFLIKHKEIEGD